MTLTFQRLNAVPDEFKHLITEDKLGELFYSDATHKYFLSEVSPIGVIAYTLDTISGKTYPRFIHVSIEPSFRASSEVNDFLSLTEMSLMSEGYTQSFAAIEHGKKYMQKTALRYGFKEWHRDEDSVYYFKDLQESR